MWSMNATRPVTMATHYRVFIYTHMNVSASFPLSPHISLDLRKKQLFHFAPDAHFHYLIITSLR